MSELTEHQARTSETELMVGRLSGLARAGDLNSDQRIGVCLAQKILEARCRELRARTAPTDNEGARNE